MIRQWFIAWSMDMAMDAALPKWGQTWHSCVVKCKWIMVSSIVWSFIKGRGEYYGWFTHYKQKTKSCNPGRLPQWRGILLTQTFHILKLVTLLTAQGTSLERLEIWESWRIWTWQVTPSWIGPQLSTAAPIWDALTWVGAAYQRLELLVAS